MSNPERGGTASYLPFVGLIVSFLSIVTWKDITNLLEMLGVEGMGFVSDRLFIGTGVRVCAIPYS